MTFTVPKFRQYPVQIGISVGTIPSFEDIKRGITDAITAGHLPSGTWEEWKLEALAKEFTGPNGQLFQVYVAARQIG